ncbi:MAG: PhoX family phosphatase [Planctomycetes bacterium]|nr:PhoX family phosphatase [Planctomycetota bacterium]
MDDHAHAADQPRTPDSISPPDDRLPTRRQTLQALAGVPVFALTAGALPARLRTRDLLLPQSSLGFKGLPNQIRDRHAVAEGYDARVLLRWGDPVVGGAPAFDAAHLSAAAQAKQAGYNCDFVAFLPLPFGSGSSTHGLLCVNHEYTMRQLMWSRTGPKTPIDEARIRVEMEAHGHSVVEVKRVDGAWQTVPEGRLNRRITGTTPIRISGPAAGDVRMKTAADPAGREVLGTLSNCGGGVTPWGTVLIAEENVQDYFSGDPRKNPNAAALRRYGLGKPWFDWGRVEARFRLDDPGYHNEANRFGWVVEIDPFEPSAPPVKRTALGRFRHEAANTELAKDGRVVVYSGDDQAFEYLYKFVSHGRYDPKNRSANKDLLDNGTLFVARLDDDGTGHWLPLVFGAGPLTPANGFHNQADVLIEARRAADLVGATHLDRPEDVEANPRSGRVYVMLTNNSGRRAEQIDAANPRGGAKGNPHGHVLELSPPGAGEPGGADHAALSFRWCVFLRAGDPRDPTDRAEYHPETDPANGWLSCPDNCAFDPKGRLWIATDQGTKQIGHGIPDGIRACDTDGAGRALTKLFFACPIGAEATGPCFTPDGTTLFVSVQHPAEGTHADGRTESSFDTPSTRWPDFAAGVPPRPSVVAITRMGGAPIGG